MSQPNILKGQVAALVSQSASESCDRERLTGGSADKKVNWFILARLYRGEITVQRRVGVMVPEHSAGECVYLGQKRRPPAENVPSARCGLNAGAD